MIRKGCPETGSPFKKMRQSETKYVRLANLIREEIDSGKLKYGDKLYSENQLCEMYGLSRQTVRHAIESLTREGLLESVRGSGTYIGRSSVSHRSKHMNIALISTHVDNYIFPMIIQGIVRTLTSAGYTTQISFTGNRVDEERRILSQLVEHNDVDGVIVEATKSALPNPNLNYYRQLQQMGVPILFFNCAYPELNLPVVSLDDQAVGEKAVRYLISRGHTRIAGIFKADDGQGKLRYTGYLNALMEAGIKIDDRRILWIDTVDQNSLHKIRASVLNRLTDCTAVFCYNDQVAFSLIKLLTRDGFKVPRQLSVMGIDGSELSTLSEPQITTIPHPLRELGVKCADNMLRMITDPTFDGNYLYNPEIVEHDSVRTLTGEKNDE